MCERQIEVESGTFQCGSIIFTHNRPKMVICAGCTVKAQQSYPQGWRFRPGDTCPHGIFLLPEDGRDVICGKCEEGV